MKELLEDIDRNNLLKNEERKELMIQFEKDNSLVLNTIQSNMNNIIDEMKKKK